MSDLAYFIYWREYADKVVEKVWHFSYFLDNVDTTRNPLGEGGAVNTRQQPWP